MRILLIEDDPGDAELVSAYLEEESDQDFTVHHVQFLAQGVTVLAEGGTDIVLLDLNLPDSSGLSTFTSLRARFPEVPIIVLSGLDDQEVSTMAVREGAQDFILKSSFTGRSLFRAIHHAIERHQLYLKLVGAALADELTGLSNRRGFMTLAGHLFKSAQRLGQGAFLLYVDLDGMKKVNDGLGHRLGDQMLRDTATVLRETFRDADVLARLGGDEFAVFGLQEAQFAEADPKARLIGRTSDFNAMAERPYSLSLSIGLACLDGDAIRSLDDMLVCADSRMYEEKRLRSNREGARLVPMEILSPRVLEKNHQPGGGQRPAPAPPQGMPRIA
jgi:diguanylate cyclase (GGDEF)-like protein